MRPDHSWAGVVARHDGKAGGKRFRRLRGVVRVAPCSVSLQPASRVPAVCLQEAAACPRVAVLR